MKKMMILAVMMVMTISANAMSYNAAKHEALFLSDKMAYELARRWPSRDGGGQSQRTW